LVRISHVILRLLPTMLALVVGMLLVLSLLVVLKSPDWSYWPLALIAGEFGHWLALLAFASAAAAWIFRGGHPVAFGCIAMAGAVAGMLLLKPVVQARALSRDLPAKLTQSFGAVKIERTAFTLGGLLGGRPEPVTPRALVYSGELSLDFYPAFNRANAPCVIVVHGGGWNGGSRAEIPHFNHWLARGGYAVAAIDYRLAPQFRWPAQREDITAAVAFLKAHASALGIDASRLVLLGRSAGGHLAEAAAYTRHDPAIRGVVALYAPADVHFAWEFSRDDDVLKSPQLLKDFLGGTPEAVRANYDEASPIRFVGQTTPPTLLIHGRLDTLVWHRQSERLDRKLTEAHVPHAFVSLPWATHAFEYNLHGPGGQLATFGIEWFLAAVTK
jgi:acetyl esterase/lipase